MFLSLSLSCPLLVLALGSFQQSATQPLATERVIGASKVSLRTAGRALSDGGWNLSSNGDLGQWVSRDTRGKVLLRVRAAGSELQSIWPRVELVVIGQERGRMTLALRKVFSVDKARYEDYRFEVQVGPGSFLVRLRFVNDGFDKEAGGDRNLFVRELGVSGAKFADTPPAWWYPYGKKAERLRARTDADIAKHRKGKLVIRAQPGAILKVEQVGHAFAFGTAVSTKYFRKPTTVVSRAYLRLLTENFNAVVAENAIKWPQSEPARGHHRWEDVDRMLQYTGLRGMRARGHCLFWAVAERVPSWVRRLDKAALGRVVEDRAWRTTARFAGRIGVFDVNNEMLVGRWYRDRLGAGVVGRMFAKAAKGQPKAQLYANEYGILTKRSRAFAYGQMIADLEREGAPVGGIGCQAHFDVPPDPNQVRRVLDYLSGHELPITITEYDFGRGNEKEKAQVLYDFLRVCFAHPAVEGFYQWGFWSGAHWKPERALWGEEGRPTPAALVYRDLVYREWWTRFEGAADGRGFVTVPAFYGTLRVTCAGKSKLVTLGREQSSLQVRF